MSNKYDTWHKIKYILFAIIPWPLFKGVALLATSIAQVAVSADFIKNGGTLEGTQDYLIEYFSNAEASIRITAVAQFVCFLIGLLILFKLLKRNDFGSPLKAFPRLTLPGTIVLMIGGAFVVLLSVSMYALFAPNLLSGYQELMSSSGLTGFTVTSILTTLVLAPLNEEVLFRGVSFAWLKKAELKFWAVNIIQALLFGLTHMLIFTGLQYGIEYMNIIQGSYAFILGLFLGYIRERTGSLWGSILGHMVFNFVGTFVVAWLAGFGESVAGLVMIVGGVVFTVIGFVLMELKRGKTENE